MSVETWVEGGNVTAAPSVPDISLYESPLEVSLTWQGGLLQVVGILSPLRLCLFNENGAHWPLSHHLQTWDD